MRDKIEKTTLQIRANQKDAEKFKKYLKEYNDNNWHASDLFNDMLESLEREKKNASELF